MKIVMSVVFVSFSVIQGFSQTLDLKGLISAWGVGSFQKTADPQLGFRFIPELFLEKSLSKKLTLDAHISLNAY